MSVAKEVISRFMAVFGEPKTPDPDGFLVEFAQCLSGCEATALRKAADTLIRRSTFWPKPAEVLELVSEILAERDRLRVGALPVVSFPQQMRDANKMIQCPLGERAAAEGWIRGLWDFCRIRGRLPGDYEIGSLITSSRRHDETVADLARNPTGLDRALLDLAAGMNERAKQLGEIVDGSRNDLTPINVKWG